MAARRTETYSGGGARIGEGGKFEGEFKISSNPVYHEHRQALFTKLFDAQTARLQTMERKPIAIELPDGTIKEGLSWETTPLSIAQGISKGLADSVVVAKVDYLEEIESLKKCVAADDDESEDEGEPLSLIVPEKDNSILWDLTRPLEGSCKLQLLKFDSAEGKDTFWHSSAHVLGEALEREFGVHLTIGPPLESGFYYDSFMGSKKFQESDYPLIEKKMQEIAKENQPFERLELSKEEALELFKHNPFKVQLITNKVPDGANTSVYRCGVLIDLCRGPHLPGTGRIKASAVSKHSSSYWLGKAELDSLQRVYAITFPSDKMLKEHKKMVEEAAKRDHRKIGTNQELFFFHPTVSPGSCFWMPMGTRIFNKLVNFMKREYDIRGFQEVITPTIYSDTLFKQSGHYFHYDDGMYGFNVEGQQWFLKPMNCPGHCVVFDHRVRSYKELPLRMASFGVLHRNELSGTLSGLTRVRRFQQDDAHIFCRMDQIKSEVVDALEFLRYVYNVFGLNFSLALSTRPKKAMGDRKMWQEAEQHLKEALDQTGWAWSINAGDGAFYGPKIDIRLVDALGRKWQCGTIQLDFQLPIRFNLQYRMESTDDKAEEEEVEKDEKVEKKEKKGKKNKGGESPSKKEDAPAPEAPKEEAPKDDAPKVGPNGKPLDNFREGKLKQGFERPVMVHRAILGSIERFSAILTEHYGGKWPFWLSPRQVLVVPVSQQYNEYASYVSKQLANFGIYAEADLTSKTLNKKVREGQIAQWNYIAVVGEKEVESMSVALRTRDDPNARNTLTLKELVERLAKENEVNSCPMETFTPFAERMP